MVIPTLLHKVKAVSVPGANLYAAIQIVITAGVSDGTHLQEIFDCLGGLYEVVDFRNSPRAPAKRSSSAADDH